MCVCVSLYAIIPYDIQYNAGRQCGSKNEPPAPHARVEHRDTKESRGRLGWRDGDRHIEREIPSNDVTELVVGIRKTPNSDTRAGRSHESMATSLSNREHTQTARQLRLPRVSHSVH